MSFLIFIFIYIFISILALLIATILFKCKDIERVLVIERLLVIFLIIFFLVIIGTHISGSFLDKTRVNEKPNQIRIEENLKKSKSNFCYPLQPALGIKSLTEFNEDCEILIVDKYKKTVLLGIFPDEYYIVYKTPDNKNLESNVSRNDYYNYKIGEKTVGIKSTTVNNEDSSVISVEYKLK